MLGNSRGLGQAGRSAVGRKTLCALSSLTRQFFPVSNRASKTLLPRELPGTLTVSGKVKNLLVRDPRSGKARRRKMCVAEGKQKNPHLKQTQRDCLIVKKVLRF